MNWSLQYLDRDGQHLDVNYFENMVQAISAAEEADWAYAFNLVGYGQVLHAKRSPMDGKLLDWIGGVFPRDFQRDLPEPPEALRSFIVG